MKKVIIALGLTAIFSLAQVTYAHSDLPKVKAKGAVLIEQESKRILYEQNSEVSLPMASTTKIMTCVLALEKGNLEDIVVTSNRAAKAPPVKLKLKVGEKQRLGDLLYALMLQSDNDVAVGRAPQTQTTRPSGRRRAAPRVSAPALKKTVSAERATFRCNLRLFATHTCQASCGTEPQLRAAFQKTSSPL